MASRAVARFVRQSPKKIGRVLSVIRGKPVVEAYRILALTPQRARTAVGKTLRSAVANAGNPDGLIITKAYAGPGPSLKRMRPRAMGRGAPYKRRSAHITIEVGGGK